LFFFSSRRRHTRFSRDWSSDVCSSDLRALVGARPDEIADTLEAEHRIVNVERYRLDAVIAVRGAGCQPRAERACLVDSFFQDLRSEERRVGKECSSRVARYQ